MREMKIIKWVTWIGLCLVLLITQPMAVCAADEEALAAIREELLEILLTADGSIHYVYDYQLTSTQIDDQWSSLIEEEGYLPYHSYGNLMPIFKSKKNGYSENIYIYGIDDGFEERYAKLQECVTEVKAAVKGMSDLEKVLYVHDYVVDSSVYDASAVAGSRAGGPLGAGKGYCSGYADAMMVLLKYVDVPCICVRSDKMSHMWNYVKVNGVWYHLDATWDETDSELTSDIEHYYFLRNDAEYTSGLRKAHYNWKPEGATLAPTSTSTTYEDWFVHDILGRMFYYNGLWYYVDNKTGNIVSSEIDVAQTSYKVRVNKKSIGASKLAVTKVENGIIYYTADGESCKQVIGGASTGLDFVIENNMVQSSNSSSLNSSASLASMNWNSFSSWKSGCYDWYSGRYITYTSRICLTDYVPAKALQSYRVNLSKGSCHMLVREMTAGKSFITSHNLTNGEIFETRSNTAYLAISLYMPNNSAATYATYKSLFANGITVGLTKTEKLNVNNSNLKWANMGYWRSGIYSFYDGQYVTDPTRVCLNDYILINKNASYKVVLSDTKYHMLVREMNSQKKFIKSHNLTNGSTFTTSANTAYLGICLYIPAKDTTAVYNDYKSVIAGGPALVAVQ